MKQEIKVKLESKIQDYFNTIIKVFEERDNDIGDNDIGDNNIIVCENVRIAHKEIIDFVDEFFIEKKEGINENKEYLSKEQRGKYEKDFEKYMEWKKKQTRKAVKRFINARDSMKRIKNYL